MNSIRSETRSAGRQAAHSTAFEALARLGFVARGVIYAIIGMLAMQVAIHSSHKSVNQRGAMETIAKQPFGHALLIAVAVGLGGYSAWRFVQAIVGHGPEGGGEHTTFGRLAALGSGIAYAGMCALAVSILIGSSSGNSSTAHTSTAGVLGWPGGQFLVSAAGALFIAIAAYQGYRGLTKRFLKEDKTGEMSTTTRRWITMIGVVGHLARMVAFGLIGVFLIKAAVDYRPSKAVGLDGALSKLAHQADGPLLLGVVAAGFVAFGLYSVADARYRRI